MMPQLELRWKASGDASSTPLSGTATCPELSTDSLAQGLAVTARVTSGAAGHADALCESVRAAVGVTVARVLESVGRAFFADLHAELGIPPPVIASPADRPPPAPPPKPKPANAPKPKPANAPAPKPAKPASGSRSPGSPMAAKAARPGRSSRPPPARPRRSGAKGWCVLAGAAVVLVGVAALLWSGSGDTDRAPQARPAPQARAPAPQLTPQQRQQQNLLGMLSPQVSAEDLHRQVAKKR